MVTDSGPAQHSQQGPGGCIGVQPTGLHMVCGLGEGVQPCSSWSPVGRTFGVWCTGPNKAYSVSV